MSKTKGILAALLGIAMIVVGIVMTVHDADYIFLNNTLDLNAHFAEDGEVPRDDYVEYKVRYTLGCYGETKEYVGGIIPIPGSKTMEYVLLCENGMIISAEIKDKDTINALNALHDAYGEDDDANIEPVTIVGCFNIVSAEMSRYLQSYLSYFDFENSDLILTDYCIDTTKTRLTLAVMYLFFVAFGALIAVFSIKKMVIGV